jgi:hypothetical protein
VHLLRRPACQQRLGDVADKIHWTDRNGLHLDVNGTVDHVCQSAKCWSARLLL